MFIALVVLNEQPQPKRALAIHGVGDPDIGPQNGFYACGPCRPIELDVGKGIAQVRDGQRRLVVRLGLFHGRLHPHDPVHDRVLRVHAQVDKTGGGHGSDFPIFLNL